MQRHSADVNSPYKRKCWTNSGGPLVTSLLLGPTTPETPKQKERKPQSLPIWITSKTIQNLINVPFLKFCRQLCWFVVSFLMVSSVCNPLSHYVMQSCCLLCKPVFQIRDHWITEPATDPDQALYFCFKMPTKSIFLQSFCCQLPTVFKDNN